MASTSTSFGNAFLTPMKRIRKLVWIASASVVFIVAGLIAAPHFIDLALFKSAYLPVIEESLHRRVDVSEVHLRLLPTPSLRLLNLRVFDRSAVASERIFFSAEQVRLRLRLRPLLKGRFEASELVLERPIFNLIKEADGRFNYADIANQRAAGRPTGPAKRPAEPPRLQSTAVPWLFPASVTIRDGQVHLISNGEPPITLRGVDLTLRNAAVGIPFPFRAAFEYPGLKNVSWSGEMIYHEDKAILDLRNNRIKLHDLTLPVEGNISNVATAPRWNLRVNEENLEARPVFQILAAFGLAPRETELSGPLSLAVSLSGPATQWFAHVHAWFKDVKVDGKRTFRGTVRGEIAIRLPAGAGPASKRLEGNGWLTARGGQLTHADLVRRIERVTAMMGLSKEERRQAITFDVMDAHFTLARGAADFSRLYLVNTQMEVTGAGTMTIDRPVLDLALRTTLSERASSRAGRSRRTSFLKDPQGRLMVPLKVAGPAENPSVELHSSRLADARIPEAEEKRFSSFFRQLFRTR